MPYPSLGGSEYKLVDKGYRKFRTKEIRLALTKEAFPNFTWQQDIFFSEHLLIYRASNAPKNKSGEIVFFHDLFKCSFSPHFWDDRWIMIVTDSGTY